jgi:hypothetical protein
MSKSVKWLESNIGWIKFTFDDGTERRIRTTKSPEILASVLCDKKDNTIFDLDLLRWVSLPTDKNVEIIITEEKPVLEEESEFVSRFI